jgi:diaminopimelate epimerase
VELFKYHALGNDYVVAPQGALRAPLAPALVRRICDRHRGAGADGLLVQEEGAPAHRLRVWNPDGSEAEKSGNGLRIFARWLFDRGLVRGGESFRVLVPAGPVACEVLDGGRAVRVEMGRVRFESRAIPVAGPPREVLDEPLEVAGRALRICAATIGNPHCVVLGAAVTEREARELGPCLERHPLFPSRTNVQLAGPEGRSRIRLEIWERGAGYTLASGTSACAAAAVFHRLGLCDRAVEVAMPGGALAVEIGEGYEVRMTGPVTFVARVELAEEALEGAE